MTKSQKHIGNFRDNVISKGPMIGEYFGRLIATGEWGVCLLSSCKVRYPQTIFFLNLRRLIFFL